LILTLLFHRAREIFRHEIAFFLSFSKSTGMASEISAIAPNLEATGIGAENRPTI
jgi:hypothetical protein